MKKILAILLSVVMLAATTAACGRKEDEASAVVTDAAAAPVANGEYDVDLTKLSSTMVYSEVSNITSNPESYLGKSVKMRGNFRVYENENNGKLYFACVIADAAACCANGIEFVCRGDYNYPADYPELDSEITVTGVFDTYEEDGYTYCQLIDAEMQTV